MKYFISVFAILAIVLVAATGVLVWPVSGEVKPYYSGDAIGHNGSLYVATTNTGKLELFRYADKKLERLSVMRTKDNRYPEFRDVVFNREDGTLFAYAIDDRFINKYDLSDPRHPRLVDAAKHNKGDYFTAIGKGNDGSLYTVSRQAVRIWTPDLQSIDSHTRDLKRTQAFGLSPSGEYYYDLIGDSLSISETVFRDNTADAFLNIDEDHDRRLFVDIDGAAYAVDDERLVKLALSGHTEYFEHTGTRGYDVTGLSGLAHVYFSDGIGIVKARRSDLKPIDWVYTNRLPRGGWAMGLRAASDNGGEKVVAFCGNNILVLNDSLDPLASFAASEQKDDQDRYADLFLNLSTNNGEPDSDFTVNGGGFRPYEMTTIEFADEKWESFTDGRGRFTAELTVPPDFRFSKTDIKATGDESDRTWSTSFTVLHPYNQDRWGRNR